MRIRLLVNSIVVALALMAFSPDQRQTRLPKEIRKHFAFIPQGVLQTPAANIPVNAFYMQKTEVTNGEYMEFINDMINTNNKEVLAVAMIDTAAWRTAFAHCEPYVTYYYKHPAYIDYPVVNVSYEGAKAYCEWKTRKALSAKTNDGYSAVYRLPGKSEWIYAAKNEDPQSLYSWGGSKMVNSKGCALCNHKLSAIGNPNVAGSEMDADNADITAIVHAYAPSKWGVYNQNGNVAEMIEEKGICMGGSWISSADEVCNTCESVYSGASPTVGFRTVMTFMKSVD